ncbi:MAG: DUF126 domain-containing protein [Cyanobacteria bacterium]|nr:DUF126 domain-containing protein [Cyanobacteriota bacterium]
MTVAAEVLLAGPAASATALALTAPISFWGGVDPKTGLVADPRHPEHGQLVTGKILLVPETVGSSSAAAILLELVHGNRAPAAIVLHEPDAILLLGLIVAKEMGYVTPIALRLDRNRYAALHGREIRVSKSGLLTADLE